MKKNISILFIGVVVFNGCNTKPDNLDRKLNTEQKLEIQNISPINEVAGLNRLKNNCYSCHNPNAVSHHNMLAPPLAGIKYKYKKLYPSEELFIAQMTDFLVNPTKANSVMKGPVNRFGLMPKTNLQKKQIQELVKYIYNNELEHPKWFEVHFDGKHNTKWKDR